MQDHRYEEPDEERERETVDALAEREYFEHHRGDDRADEQLRTHLELFALGASLPSTRLAGESAETNTRAACGTGAGHMPLLSQPPVPLVSPAPEGAGGPIEEAA